MNVSVLLAHLLLCSWCCCIEYGLFFQNEEAYLQASYETICDESGIKFDVLINRTSGVVIYAENKVRSVTMIAYFERPGMYLNVTDGSSKYSLPLTLDFFSNQWLGWHEVEVRFTEHRMHLIFDSTERQIAMHNRYLFPEDVVEENEIYFGASPAWPGLVGNVTRFSGFMRNMKHKSCGCAEWKPIKILKSSAVSREFLGECRAHDACRRDCPCYLFPWGGKRCDCPTAPCVQASDKLSLVLDKDLLTSGRLQAVNIPKQYSTENGPFGSVIKIEPKNRLQLFVATGRTCFKNIFLCDSGFSQSFWILPTVLGVLDREHFVLKHAGNLESQYGMSVSRIVDHIHVTITTRDGDRLSARLPVLLSVWSLVTIVYNQSSLNLYMNSDLRESSNKSVNIGRDLSQSSRFLFIGNDRDYPSVTIGQWSFSSDLRAPDSTIIKELRLEQSSGLRRVNPNCPLSVESKYVNMADCYRLMFGNTRLFTFHLSLIIHALNNQSLVILQSSFVSIIIESPSILMIDIDGVQSLKVTLTTRASDDLYYIEVSLTDRGNLVVVQNMNMVLFNDTLHYTGDKNLPSKVDFVRVNSNFEVLMYFRMLNVDRDFGIRSRRVLTDYFTRYKADVSVRYIDTYQSTHVTKGILDQAVLLQYPSNHISARWFNDSCVRYLASCYHGLTLSLSMKMVKPFRDVSEKYFQIFTSGTKGLSFFIETDGLFFIVITESLVITKFVPKNPMKISDRWYLIEISISQNGVPFLFVNREESPRREFLGTSPVRNCKEICVGDEVSRDKEVVILIDELYVWDVERQYLQANGYIHTGLIRRKLISFTKYQLKETFNMYGSAKIISTKNGYALALNNFGARFATINVEAEPRCFSDFSHCRQGILIRLWLRPDNLALYQQTIIASASVTVNINLEYVSVQVRVPGKTWFVTGKDLLQLFVWHLLEISWHRNDGLRLYINGNLSGYSRNSSDYAIVTYSMARSISVGWDHRNKGNINFATVIIDDIELFEADRSNIGYDRDFNNDKSCAVLFNFDDSSETAIMPALGIVGSAGIFDSTTRGAIRIQVPKCFHHPFIDCTVCFTLRMWMNIRKTNVTVLNSGFVTLAIFARDINIVVGDLTTKRQKTFICRNGDVGLLNTWNFLEISWDKDEGLLLFINREGIECELRGEETMNPTGVFEYLEVSREYVGAIDELELYRARISVLYWRQIINETKELLIIDRIREKARVQKEVILLKKALESSSVNRSVEVVDSFQVNGTNYVSYKLPKNAYSYIPGGREEVEISFKSFNSRQSSIIWVSDSLLSKNTLTLKNKKLYFTKVYILPSSNTSQRLTEELEIHNNILSNVIYNVVIYQRVGEIVMKTTSVNESNIQSMIGRDPLLPMNSDIYFGGYNDRKFMKFNQINSSLSGIIYKARLKSASHERPIDIIQEMAVAKQNPNIGNHGNVIVMKKVIKADKQTKTSFLATLSYRKVPLMISSPFLSLRLPKWDFSVLTSVEIEFSTLESRGSLLFVGNRTAFISLEIFDSQLFYVSKFNGSLTRIRAHSDRISVSDNKPYSIYIGHDLSGNTRIYFNRERVIDIVTKVGELINSVSVIGHLGSYNDWPIEVLSRVSFIGCIHFVRINDADYLNFSRKSSLLKYEEYNFYAGVSDLAESPPFKTDACEEPSLGACDKLPCQGGWCQLTWSSVIRPVANNFKCNCLLSSKSLANGFTDGTALHNYNVWLYEYLLQSRSKPCIEDKQQLVIVDDSSFTVTFTMTFPFVAVLDLEFLVLVKSEHSCLLEVSFQDRDMSVLIIKSRLLMNIGDTNVLNLTEVDLHDNQWHGIQIMVRLHNVRVKVDSLQKEFSFPSMPSLIVQRMRLGNCGGYRLSHFLVKGLRYNSLNILSTTSLSTHKLFYSTQYLYPQVSTLDHDSRSSRVPVTLLNNFHSAVTARPLHLTWFTQLSFSLSTLYRGSVVHIVNGRQQLSSLLCRDQSLMFIHRNNVKQPSIERVKLLNGRIKFTITIDLIRHVVSLNMSSTNSTQIVLGFDMNSWHVSDAVHVHLGVYNDPTNDIINLSGLENEDPQCLEDSSSNTVIGCLDTFLWSDATKTISLTDQWDTMMTSSSPGDVIVGQCKVVAKCLPKTCANGVCNSRDHVSTYCDCSGTEYTGDRCHLLKDRCSKHSCLHNGICIPTTDYNGRDTAICNCTGTGHSGVNCENILCPDSYCANQGRCYTNGGTLMCDCGRTKFSGSRCETPVCSVLTCNGHGVCQIIDNTSAPICHCHRGFFGDFCDVASKGMCQGQCRNGGICSKYQPTFKMCSNRYCRQWPTYHCDCEHTVFRGEFCEHADIGFHPVHDGLLLMGNITVESHNYLRILFDIDSVRDKSVLVTVAKTAQKRLILVLVNRTLSLRYTNRLGPVSYAKTIGIVAKINVLLLGESDSRVDFYLNNKTGYVNLSEDPNLDFIRRKKRDVPGEPFMQPYIVIGCSEASQDCFDGLVAGVTWNDQRLMDPRNYFVKNSQRYPVASSLVRPFPKQGSYIVFVNKHYTRSIMIVVAVILVIFLFAFYISRKLWYRSRAATKVYINNGRPMKNGLLNHSIPVDVDEASEMVLIESNLVDQNYTVPDSSPDLSSQEYYESKLTAKSISSSILSEMEYCRILLVNDVPSIHKLNVIDYTPVPGNQVVIGVTFLPEIKICQNLFPVDGDDMQYKCAKIFISPGCHYLYCYMTPLQGARADEYEMQAWKVGNPYQLLVKPPNVTFTYSAALGDDSYRIILMNKITGKLSLFEMELSTTLWARSMTHCYEITANPLVLVDNLLRLVVNKEHSFSVVDISNGVLLNTYMAPAGAALRQMVATDYNRLIILTDNYDLYHWDFEEEVYDHKQLPIRVTMVVRSYNYGDNKIVLGLDTGEMYVSLDQSGLEYLPLGPRNDKMIVCMRLSLDGSLLAAAYENNLVHIWHLSSEVPLVHFHAVHERGDVLDVNFTSDNRRLLVLVVTNRTRPSFSKRIMIIDIKSNDN